MEVSGQFHRDVYLVCDPSTMLSEGYVNTAISTKNESEPAS
jgi:hypothetical protein